MKFPGLGKLSFFKEAKETSFSSIEGYDDLKKVIQRALDSPESYNILVCGPPASSKTQNCVYFDAANTSNFILQALEKEKPRIALLDEIDKMPRIFAEKLLNFLESGHIKVDQRNCQMDFQLKGVKVIATANEVSRISKPLQSIFMKFFLSKYTESQFLSVSEKVLPKLSSSISGYIGKQIFDNGGDIRAVISVGKLVKQSDGPNEISEIISTISKYKQEVEKK